MGGKKRCSEHAPRVCKVCGKEFIPWHGNQVTCSTECRDENIRHHHTPKRKWVPEERQCAVCGTPFIARDSRHVCCCKSCGWTMWKTKQLEKKAQQQGTGEPVKEVKMQEPKVQEPSESKAEIAARWNRLVYEPNRERVAAYRRFFPAQEEVRFVEREHSENSCQWCRYEFCTNADCPVRGDYCPVEDYPGVCRFESRDGA